MLTRYLQLLRGIWLVDLAAVMNVVLATRRLKVTPPARATSELKYALEKETLGIHLPKLHIRV